MTPAMKNNETHEPVWLICPVALTMTHHDYSLQQMRMMVVVVGKLQGILHDVLNNRRMAEHNFFRPDELDAGGRLSLKILFKELGVSANHYARLGESLTAMSSMPVELPVKRPQGRVYMRFQRLFHVELNDSGERVRHAIVSIDQDVARIVCSLESGYHQISRDAIFACRNRVSPRLYMLAAAWTGQSRVYISRTELRNMLGLQTSYPNFSDLMRRVVQPVAGEIKRLADRGLCKCYFEVENPLEVLHSGRRRTEVSMLIKKVGVSANDITQMQRMQMVNILCRYFKFTPDNANKVVDELKPDCYQTMMSKLTALYQRMNNDHGIKDRAAYVYRSVQEFLNVQA